MEISLIILGIIIGAAVTTLIFCITHMCYESKHQSNNSSKLNKQKILSFMSQRMDGLRLYIDKDFGGHLTGHHEAFREVKYWKEAIERGCFDEDEVDDN